MREVLPHARLGPPAAPVALFAMAVAFGRPGFLPGCVVTSSNIARYVRSSRLTRRAPQCRRCLTVITNSTIQPPCQRGFVDPVVRDLDAVDEQHRDVAAIPSLERRVTGDVDLGQFECLPPPHALNDHL